MKKYVLIILLTSIFFILLFFILDIVNITQYIPFTARYDWLGFAGGYMGSMLGGIVTLTGVYQTIKYEKEKDFEKSKLSYKPYFYNIDPFSEYDPKNTLHFIFSEDASYKNKQYQKLIVIIRNTDNAILIIDYMSINKVNYYPAMGNVINKNETVYLEVFYNGETIELKDIELYTKDVIGNIYKYKLEYNLNDNKIVELREEI